MSEPTLRDILSELEINIEINTESEQGGEDPIEDSLGQEQVAQNSVSGAVAQTNVEVIGESPSMAEAELHQVLSQSTSITVQNAVNVQKQLTQTHQATTTKKIRDFLAPQLKKEPRTTFEKSLKRFTEIMKEIEEMNS